MSATPKQLKIEKAALGNISRGPLPGSRKIYVSGSLHPFIRVPMREITQTSTRLGLGSSGPELSNPPVVVYDSSGPFSDAGRSVDLGLGLEPVRAEWIRAGQDVQELSEISSEYGRQRLKDARLDDIRFHRRRKALVAGPGHAVTQLHYARRGIITPEMEFVAIRENQRGEAFAAAQHPGNPF